MDFGFGEFFENLERSKTGATSSPPSTYSFYRTNEELEKHRQDKKARRAAFFKLIDQQDPKQHIKPERPVIDQYIADGKKVFQNLFLRMNKVTEDFVDNVDLKPIPKNFKITEDKYEHVELIQGLFDEEEELQKSQLKEKNLKKNQAIMTCISYLEKRSFPFNSSNDQTSFSLHKEEFFKNFNGWQFEKNRLLYFQKYKAFDTQQQHREILEILKYEEKEIDQFKNIFLAYIPSGGGKSTMYKKYKSFVKMLDVDEFIRENYQSFQLFQEFINQIDIPHEGIMTLWFKYKLDLLYQKDDFDDVLLLFNHPNQFPNYFRRKYNEIILMPEKFNWDVRFFAENYFSLACVLGKHKTVLRYDQYLSYILEFFSVFFSPTRIRKIIKKKIYGYSPFNQPQPVNNQMSDNNISEQAHSHSSNNKRVNTWLDSFLESVETERKRIRYKHDRFNLV